MADVYVVVVESSEEAFIALSDLGLIDGPIELARDMDEAEAIQYANDLGITERGDRR